MRIAARSIKDGQVGSSLSHQKEMATASPSSFWALDALRMEGLSPLPRWLNPYDRSL